MRGFSLIELLMVIAIIGILVSVMVPSLNDARDKAADAAIMTNLNGVRSRAEILFDTTSTYAAVCADSDVARAVTESGSFWSADCADDTYDWAVESELSDGTWYCIDSVESATTTPASSIADGSDYECG